MATRRIWIGLVAIFVVAAAFVTTQALGIDRQDNLSLSNLDFSLTKPLFAQSSSVVFPVDDAGISAYVNVDPAGIDFEEIITAVFTDVIVAGDNYVIGTIPIEQARWSSRTAEVNVYVDSDGWLVAYLTEDTPYAEIFSWTNWKTSEPELVTTLEIALETVADVFGESTAESLVGWYYWDNPDATHFAAAVRSGNGSLYMAVPTNAVVYGVPSYSFHSKQSDVTERSGSFQIDRGGEEGIIFVGGAFEDFFWVSDLVMEPGIIYRFWAKDSNISVFSGQHFIGVAIVYGIP